MPIVQSYKESLTPAELAFLNGTRQFTKAQARYMRCRLNKKLRGLGAELSELQRLSRIAGCNAAAANEREGCNGPNNLLLKQAGPRGFDPLTCGSEDLASNNRIYRYSYRCPAPGQGIEALTVWYAKRFIIIP